MVPWHRWGTYLAERQWGTVREDYSRDGRAWEFFPYEHSSARVYRWGEDGLLGLCDDQMRLCFALALWNEADSHVKERLFGLTGPQGNHGEDVKECYYYLDGTPTHSYMRALYRYPQRAFPYEELRLENSRRTRIDAEWELIDTGIFADRRYFDVTVEYAKASPTDICIRISATNQGSAPAPLHLLPTLWFRNTWSWGRDAARPVLQTRDAERCLEARHPTLGTYWLFWHGKPRLLFTDNETNLERLWQVPNRAPYTRDGINSALVEARDDAVNAAHVGTRMAADYAVLLPGGATETLVLRLSAEQHASPFAAVSDVFAERQSEADQFYGSLPGAHALSDDERLLRRQAYAGLLWSKQVYIWDLPQWMSGDPAGPPPPPERRHGRNSGWAHFNTTHVLSVPDAWEYPWFAAWDLAFHCVPLAHVDPEFAKDQLTIMLREWYMHPNGQIPAYEWAFDDVNPPVHAWAAWRVYQIDRQLTGTRDRGFLERVFHKLLLNFTWWVNRKDPTGLNVFQGGFLGLDNIGVFDRSIALPSGGNLEQSDGTAWMGMYCLNMLVMALELARDNDAYEEIANKFFQHFLYVASAMNNVGGKGYALWDEDDEFFYDVLHTPSRQFHRLRVRSLVGLIPLLAVETIEPDLLQIMPQFKTRLEWVLANRPELGNLISRWHEPGLGERRLLALVRGHRMKLLLRRMLDPDEFLSDFGIRSVSKFHKEHPFSVDLEGAHYEIEYEPGESKTGMFGGNSNWRGPVWMPINYLLIEALRKFHHYYGDDFRVECPTASGQELTLDEIAAELSRRLTRLFLRGEDGRRPVFGDNQLLQTDPRWRDNLLFYEYFHGDTGAGLGASHQTGWTALVANL
ncbi:MAG: glucosidase [Chloroflexi bacterium]|nr:glucosidase [Chloroflexota bacterium]